MKENNNFLQCNRCRVALVELRFFRETNGRRRAIASKLCSLIERAYRIHAHTRAAQREQLKSVGTVDALYIYILYIHVGRQTG